MTMRSGMDSSRDNFNRADQHAPSDTRQSAQRACCEPLEPRRLLTTFYIATNGADTNSGLDRAHPYATIQQGLNGAVNPGDIVELAGGTYRNQFGSTFQGDGASGNPITLRAAAGAKVIVDGAQIVTRWSADGSRQPVYTASRSSSYYFGALDANNGDARDEARNQLYIDGTHIPEVQKRSAMSAGTFYFDQSAQKLYVWTPDGSSPASHVVEATATENALLSTDGHSYLVVDGIVFQHCANPPQESAEVKVLGGQNVLIRNVTVQYAAGADLSISGTNNQLLKSHFNYAGQEGFNSGGAVGLSVINCETAFNDTLAGKGYSQGWEAGGSKIAFSTGTVIDGLVSHDNLGDGLWFDIANQNATIHNCVIYNNRGNGIHYEISYTATIYNNLIYNTHYLSNDLYAPDGYGIYLSSSAKCSVYDNTIVGSESVGIDSVGGPQSDGFGYDVWSYGNQIFNNVVAFNQTVSNYAEIDVQDTTSQTPEDPANGPLRFPWTTSSSDYNVFYSRNTDGSNFGTGYISFTDWQQNNGQDLHSHFADPQFVDPANNQYQLPAKSPYRSTGNTGGTVGVDFTSLPLVITSDAPLSTGASSVTFNVAFSEPVNNVTTAAFGLETTGTAAGTISSVSASSGTKFTVTVSSITGRGGLRLDLLPTGSVRAASNRRKAALGYTGGVVASVPLTSTPIVTSIIPFTTAPTTDGSLAYKVTFNKPVFGVSLGNFQVSGAGSATGSILPARGQIGPQFLADGATTYWVIVGPTTADHSGAISGNGTLRLDFSNRSGNVKDASGHTASSYSAGVAANIGTPGTPVVSASAVDSIRATRGVAFTATIANFIDSVTTSDASSYSATIFWGDGNTSHGDITSNGALGSFKLNGTHTYASAGTYATTMLITPPAGNAVTATGSVVVRRPTTATAKSTIVATGLTGTRLVRGFLTIPIVATFIDSILTIKTSTYSVVIDWGDGTTSIGTVTPGRRAGRFSVLGTHTYGAADTYITHTTITPSGQSSATASGSIIARRPV